MSLSAYLFSFCLSLLTDFVLGQTSPMVPLHLASGYLKHLPDLSLIAWMHSICRGLSVIRGLKLVEKTGLICSSINCYYICMYSYAFISTYHGKYVAGTSVAHFVAQQHFVKIIACFK